MPVVMQEHWHYGLQRLFQYYYLEEEARQSRLLPFLGCEVLLLHRWLLLQYQGP